MPSSGQSAALSIGSKSISKISNIARHGAPKISPALKAARVANGVSEPPAQARCPGHSRVGFGIKLMRPA